MLELHNIAIALQGRPLISAFSLSVQKGETVTLMGPSGSGKSSILALIGGDLPAVFTAAGDVRLNGMSMLGLAPERRHIGRLFQDDLLFPHMTVGENLLFACPRASPAVRLVTMREALMQAGLEGFEARSPHTLSGGQRARVALMRTLLAGPEALLLDEPFNKLDQDLRTSMRNLVFAKIREQNIPALLVTHDRDDAPHDGRVFKINPKGEVTHA